MGNAAPSATTTLSNWDYHNFHVQQELMGGEFVSAETTLVAAGPPRIGEASNSSPQEASEGSASIEKGDLAFPIGLLENVGLSQSKQLQRLFEIGSSRSYFIPGRVVGSVTLGRVLYHGPSLLKVMYAYYTQRDTEPKFMDMPISELLPDHRGINRPHPNRKLLELGDLQDQLHTVKMRPGFDDFFLNLASDLFNQPTGLCIYFKNGVDVTVGSVYLENCYVQGHQLSISSGSVLIMEGVSVQFERLFPIQMNLDSNAAAGD